MMKDIEIKISRETRMVDLSKTTIGNDGENLQGNLVFSFTDDFVKGQGRLEYVINGESKYAFLLSNDENYYIPIKSVMTKEGQIDMQLVITEGTDVNEIPIFKSNVFYVSCKKSINAEVEEEEGYYSWIEIANTKLNEIDEVVKNVETKLANGEFNGKDGVDGKDGKDFTYEDFTEEQLENLRGPQGVPGEPGADGKDYVLTEADKEEIADNINEENNDRITENEKDISDLEATIDILTNTDTKKGELVHITDALPLPTFENKVDGNVKQETTKGTNEFNAYAIKNTNIVVEDNGKTIKMPVATEGNGISSTQSKLKELCPNLKVGDTVYLYFNRNLPLTDNRFIYLGTSDFIWWVNTSRTITQTDLDGVVNLYGNRASSGETEQCILTDFQITKVQNAPWEKFTNNQASPNPEYPQEIEVIEGYNLLKITIFTDGSKEQIKNGVTATINDDGTITCKGTATDAIIFYLTKNDLDFTLGDGYFLCNSPSANQRVEFNCSTDGTDKYLNSYGTGNFINVKTSFVFKMAYIVISKGEEVDVTFKPMFAKGKIQKPYLPYGCVGYKVVGKNISPVNNKTITGTTSASSTIGNIQGTAIVKDIPISQGAYTLSYNKPSGINRLAIFLYNGSLNANSHNATYTEIVSGGKGMNLTTITGNTATINIPSGYEHLAITTNNDSSYPASTNVTIEISNLQLEKGSVATDYEPYKEQIVYLDLKGNWVGAINDDIRDYLVTDKKKLWLVKNMGKIVLDGTIGGYNVDDNWFYASFNSLGITPKLLGYGKTFISNRFIDRELVTDKTVNGISYSNVTHMIIRNTDLTNIDEYRTWLSSNNVEVYYPLAEPQIIELGELPEPIKTFEGVNNIQLLANLDTEIEVVYALDVKKYYDNKLAEISAQII